MSKFRKSKRPEVPTLNTASLPDLVFTLLFFFIILSNVSDVIPKMKVAFEEPVATEYNATDKNVPNTYIYVGQMTDELSEEKSTPIHIQINDQLVSISELKDYFIRLKSSLSPVEQAQMTVSIRADKDTPMQTIQDIEEALREVKIVKVNYAVRSL